MPNPLKLLSDFLDCLQFKKKLKSPDSPHVERKPGLYPGAFVISDDFDAPLPDNFWLGDG
ncbi:MAG: DUF2281 domain-containing protein [Cyanobacteria bacterium J06621_3]